MMALTSDLREWWDARRDAAGKTRAGRRERRLMRTSTFDALAENMGLEHLDENERDPYAWPQADLESVLADTITVERRRWLERASWIALAVTLAGFGFIGGRHIHEENKPQPWVCEITLLGETAEDPDKVRCTGGTGEVIQ